MGDRDLDWWKDDAFSKPARFGQKSFNAIAVAVATMTGIIDGDEVFPDLDAIQNSEKIMKKMMENGGETPPSFERNMKDIDHIKSVLLNAREKSERKKREARDRWLKNLGEAQFNKYGWMFSEFYPAKFSANQATITTYV